MKTIIRNVFIFLFFGIQNINMTKPRLYINVILTFTFSHINQLSGYVY